MRGIRIWHLAALGLSVPLLAAAVPSGCTGLLNSNFVAGVMGQSGASASMAAPEGFIVLSFFNRTGILPPSGVRTLGDVTFNAIGAGGKQVSAYDMPLYADKPSTFLWACDQWLSEIDLTGGNINTYDPTTNQVTAATQIAYTGGPLTGSQTGEPLECGSLIEANITMVGVSPRIDVEMVK